MSAFAVRGTVMHTPDPDRLEVLDDHVVCVGSDGVVESVSPRHAFEGVVDLELAEGEYLLPGLIDLHVHAPQWPQRGAGLDKPLEDWLFDYTFPLEARYDDLAFAQRVWQSLVAALLSRGTTTAVYFASRHSPATVELARTCLDHGQRAWVGRVAMDHPTGTPDWYRDDSASASVQASLDSLDAIRVLDPTRLVQGAITPRFVPACTDALLEGLGELATATGTLTQTHCSESDWEHDAVLDRYGVTDSVALQRFGLAGRRSVLAHGDHVTIDDQLLLAQTGATIAHCPLSNSYFANAVLPVRDLLDRQVGVGLGTDIAGGSQAGLLRVCEHAVTVSRMLADGTDPSTTSSQRGRPNASIDIVTAFYLATVGGANALDLNAGVIAPGNVFDALTIRTGPTSTIDTWPELDTPDRVFERIVRLSETSDITRVFVNGRRVAGSLQ